METIDFTEIRGHILVPVAAGMALLDTGSPASCSPVPLSFGGREHRLPATVMGVSPEEVGRLAGMQVDALIGCDLLSSLTLRIRWIDRQIDIGDDIPDGGLSTPFTALMGTPVFPLGIGGGERRVLFDTGAHLSYIDPGLVEGMRPVGDREDFHPMNGHYTAPVYMMETSLGGRSFGLEYGVLPGALRQMASMAMAMAGASAIVGTALLEHFDCTLSWPRGTVSWT